jgi:hypothetical protein
MSESKFEELNRITSKAREDLNLKNIERFKLAREEAINHITIGYIDKMEIAAKRGYDQTDLYTAGRAENKSLDCDPLGNKVKFGDNVWLIDIITKGRKEFLSELNDFFNKDGNSEYHCGIYPKKDIPSNTLTYHIFVSWSNSNTQDNTNNKQSNTVFRGGKNNFYNNEQKNGLNFKNKPKFVKKNLI